jgi:hypothetical protein
MSITAAKVRAPLDNSREAIGPVVAVAGEAADARANPAHHQSVAIVLDFVDPQWAGRWPCHLRRLARFDEAGGTPQGHGRRITARTGGVFYFFVVTFKLPL